MRAVGTISVRELDHYYGDDRALIIDLRSRKEYEANHFLGAVNVPYSELESYVPPRDRTVILYCERGGTSMYAARELMKKGCRTKSVVGGIRAYKGPNLSFPAFHSKMR